MSFIRKISPLDCSYLATDTSSSSPMVNQYVIEGIGNFSHIEFKSALEEVAEKNPGIRLQLKGKWFWRYWSLDGQYPRIISHRSEWLGDSSQNAVFDGGLLDCRKGESAEVHYFEGDTPKIIFRTHHAIMDGNATLFWIKEVFRALRGEALLGSKCELSEWDIAEKNKKPAPAQFFGPWVSIFPKLKNSVEYSLSEKTIPCIWQNIIFKGSDERVLPKVIAFINERARSLSDNPAAAKVLIRIPCDLRRLLPEDSTFQLSNLVSVLDLELEAGLDEKTIYKRILSGLKNKQDLAIFSKAQLVAKFLPKKMFLHNKAHFLQLHQKGLADITAIVTHVGRIRLSEISTENFKALNIYATPVPLEGVSLSCVFIAHDKGLSLCMSAPRSLASHEDLKKLGKDIEHFVFKEK